MIESKIIEEIASSWDKNAEDKIKKRKPFRDRIKNETVLFLIKKGIVKKDKLYHYGFSREYYLGYKKKRFKAPVICCDHSKVKFINESNKKDLINI